MESIEPCHEDCVGQNYPSYPYDDGDEQLFSKVLPIVLSAMVVVISWLAGRFIDKIDISTQGSMNRVKLGTVTQSVKRSASHDKAADFHSSARGGSVQELDRLSIADDEGRLYNEHYGSEHSQEDGDRYDALGDSPGAPGPSRHPPRSPSVYSQFSQSVFSQSAYGPSAYGPSQRRLTGSVYGHSQYDNASSQGSQYPGPVPSHFGASQLSENTSYHATGSAGSHQPGGAFVQGNIPATYGGDMGRGAGMAQRLPPPTYNPYASRQGGGRVAAGRGVGIVGMRGGMASGQGLAVTQEGVAVSGFNRGSPPPYSQAQMAQAHAQAQAHHAPVMVLPNDPRLSQQQGIAASLAGVPGAGPGVTHQTASLVAPPPALMAHTSGLPPAVPAVHPSVSIANPSVSVVSPAEHPVGVVSGTTGPKSGFGSDSDDGAASEVPSAFRP